MSRWHSDAPINLIARIPSPEQMSAARPKQRSFSQLVMESGATCVRGIAEVVAQLHRLGRSISLSISDRSIGRVSLGRAEASMPGYTRSATETTYLSDDRSAHGIPDTGSAVRSVQILTGELESAPARVSQPQTRTAESVPLEEVISLRSELSAHQQEVTRLSTQLQELKAMVGSQQQVLAYLGQELEAQQMPILSAAAHAAPPAKKTRVVRAKSVSKAPPALRSASREPSLNL